MHPHPAPLSDNRNRNRCVALNVLSAVLRRRSRRLCSWPRGWHRSMQRHPKRTTRSRPDASNVECWRHSRLGSRPIRSNAGDARVEICLAQSAAQDHHCSGNRTHRTNGTREHANTRTRERRFNHQFHDDAGLANALSGKVGNTGDVFAPDPSREGRAGQHVRRVVSEEQKQTRRQSHRVCLQGQPAADGRSRRSQRPPCQFEICPRCGTSGELAPWRHHGHGQP